MTKQDTCQGNWMESDGEYDWVCHVCDGGPFSCGFLDAYRKKHPYSTTWLPLQTDTNLTFSLEYLLTVASNLMPHERAKIREVIEIIGLRATKAQVHEEPKSLSSWGLFDVDPLASDEEDHIDIVFGDEDDAHADDFVFGDDTLTHGVSSDMEDLENSGETVPPWWADPTGYKRLLDDSFELRKLKEDPSFGKAVTQLPKDEDYGFASRAAYDVLRKAGTTISNAYMLQLLKAVERTLPLSYLNGLTRDDELARDIASERYGRPMRAVLHLVEIMEEEIATLSDDELLTACFKWIQEVDGRDGLDNIDSALYDAIIKVMNK